MYFINNKSVTEEDTEDSTEYSYLSKCKEDTVLSSIYNSKRKEINERINLLSLCKEIVLQDDISVREYNLEKNDFDKF